MNALLPPLGVVVHTECHGCDDFPWWEQALLTLVACGIAFLILYGLYRLAMRWLGPKVGLEAKSDDPPCGFGALKGQIEIADDFDATPADFDDYT